MNRDQDADSSIATATILWAIDKATRVPPYTSAFRYIALTDAAWKYVETTLLQNELPLAEQSQLNDPFDAHPTLIDDLSYQDRRAFAKGLPSPIDIEGIQVRGNDGSTLASQEIAKHITATVVDLMREDNAKHRLASFSRRINSQLLWSHYAGKYTGLAYHFIACGDDTSDLRNLLPVKYTLQRPIIALSEIVDRLVNRPGKIQFFENWLSYRERAFLTKSAEWSYEEEVRLIEDAHVARFAARELASVVVGPNFSEDSLGRLRAVIAKRERPLPIFRARLSEADYLVEVEWSKPI